MRQFILIIALTTIVFTLFAQEVRLEEGIWKKVEECEMCILCNCLKCPYEGTNTDNYGNPFNTNKTVSVPKKVEQTTITAYCGEQLIGEYPITRTNSCRGGYSYGSDIEYLRTTDGYLPDPHIKYGHNGYAMIKRDAQAYCNAGEQRKTIAEIKQAIENRTVDLAADFPMNSISREELINTGWRDLARGLTYEFNESKVSGNSDVGNYDRYGKWSLTPDGRYIQLEWKATSYYPANREIISINRKLTGEYKLYSTYRNKIHTGPMVKQYDIIEAETVRTEEFQDLYDNLNWDGMEQMRECGICYWKEKEYQLGETIVRWNKSYKKKIVFTCTDNQQGTYWESELLDNPFFIKYDMQNCITCGNGRHSPGFYEEYWDLRGKYAKYFCVVSFDERKNRIVARQVTPQTLEKLAKKVQD